MACCCGLLGLAWLLGLAILESGEKFMAANLEGDYTPSKLVKYLHARDHPGYAGNNFDSSYLKPTGGKLVTLRRHPLPHIHRR